MHVSTKDIPIRIDTPMAVARQVSDFGAAFGVMGAEHYTMSAGTDLAPLLEGLRDDVCHSAHWGFVVSGDVIVTYADGTTERCCAGDLFHWPGGHSIRVESDTELVLFSPQSEHLPVMDHIADKIAAAASAG